MSLFWLSFADADKPRGQQFQGVIVVEAASLTRAIMRTHSKAINPGGGVVSVEIPQEASQFLARVPRDRLLDRDDLERLGLDPRRVAGLG